jgi:hypothetical protein
MLINFNWLSAVADLNGSVGPPLMITNSNGKEDIIKQVIVDFMPIFEAKLETALFLKGTRVNTANIRQGLLGKSPLDHSKKLSIEQKELEYLKKSVSRNIATLLRRIKEEDLRKNDDFVKFILICTTNEYFGEKLDEIDRKLNEVDRELDYENHIRSNLPSFETNQPDFTYERPIPANTSKKHKYSTPDPEVIQYPNQSLINNNYVEETVIGKRSLASLDQESLFYSGISPLLVDKAFDAFVFKESD